MTSIAVPLKVQVILSLLVNAARSFSKEQRFGCLLDKEWQGSSSHLRIDKLAPNVNLINAPFRLGRQLLFQSSGIKTRVCTVN